MLFLIHQLLQKVFFVNLELVDAYLDNLLAMPIVLTLLQAERYWLSGSNSKNRLSMLELIMCTIYICLASELLFPMFSPAFTADPVDLAVYFTGTLLYWCFGTSKIPLKG